MTLEQVRNVLNACPGLKHIHGDIDEYWENDEVKIMLTHTVWCEGEDNDKHELLVFKKEIYGIPMLITEFTEEIPKD